MSPRTTKKLTPEQRRERLEQAQQLLNTAVEEMTTSEGWRALIRSRAWLRHYSLDNVLMILKQCPHARDVRTFGAWLNSGRAVRAGERGIRIREPLRYRAKAEDTDQDGDDTEPGYVVKGFTVATRFDISQTEGDPVAEPVDAVPQELRGAAPDQLWELLAGMVTARGYTLERGDCGDAYGYVDHPVRTVRVRDGVDPAQAVKTLTHELAHILCEHSTRAGLTRAHAEVEAESVACLVTAVMGLDTLGYSVPYVAGWAEDAKVAHAAANRVMTVADQITHHLVNDPHEEAA